MKPDMYQSITDQIVSELEKACARGRSRGALLTWMAGWSCRFGTMVLRAAASTSSPYGWPRWPRDTARRSG